MVVNHHQIADETEPTRAGGFIALDDGGADVFVHARDVVNADNAAKLNNAGGVVLNPDIAIPR